MGVRSVPIWLGLAGLVGAIALGAITGRFLPWHLWLGALSLLSMAGGLFWLQDVKWRATLASLVYSVFFVLCVAIAYMISANRYVVWDITKDRVHTLDRQTRAILAQLPANDRFVIQAFAPAKEHPQLERFLQSYRNLAPQLAIQMVDPARDIDVSAAMATPPRNGDLVVIRHDPDGMPIRRVNDTLTEAQYAQRENIVTNAIAKTLLDERVVYFITGHGERSIDPTGDAAMSKMADLIESTSSPVRPFRLIQEPVPDNAAALVIAGPARDLFDPELVALQQYLEEGGKLILLLDPRAQVRMDNFERLLADLGLESPNGLIVDPLMANQTNSSFTPLVQYNRHPITANIDGAPLLLGQARPLVPAAEVPAELKMEALLVTSEQSWFERYEDLRSIRRPVPPQDSREMRRQLAGVTVQRDTRGAKFGNEMRVVVLGDSDAFLDSNIEQNTGAASFMLASLRWAREDRALIYVPPKILTSTPINLTATQFWTLMGLFVLMSAMITFGGTAWTMARRRSR